MTFTTFPIVTVPIDQAAITSLPITDSLDPVNANYSLIGQGNSGATVPTFYGAVANKTIEIAAIPHGVFPNDGGYGIASFAAFNADLVANPLTPTVGFVAGMSQSLGSSFIYNITYNAAPQLPMKFGFYNGDVGGVDSFTEAMRIDSRGNVVINTAAIATNATDGFLYIPTCAGPPTGTPTTYTGRVPMIYDTTNHKFYIYDGGWKGGTNPGVFT